MNESPSEKLVLSQPPNLPLIAAIATSALSLLVFANATLGRVFIVAAFGCWFTWAWLELFQGSNWFRRVLGAAVFVVLFAAALVGLQVFLR